MTSGGLGSYLVFIIPFGINYFLTEYHEWLWKYINEIWERVLANSFSGIHKSKIICSERLGGNWFKKKNRIKKSRDTVPLKKCWCLLMEMLLLTLWATDIVCIWGNHFWFFYKCLPNDVNTVCRCGKTVRASYLSRAFLQVKKNLPLLSQILVGVVVS